MARPGLKCVLLQSCKLSNEDDLLLFRSAVKMHAADMKFSAFNQTKLVTAASELGRNVLEHGKGGSCQIDMVTAIDGKKGICMMFKDHGPGIPDIEQALVDGFSSGKGLGLGLSGSKRLMDEFEIQTKVGEGTLVVITKWT